MKVKEIVSSKSIAYVLGVSVFIALLNGCTGPGSLGGLGSSANEEKWTILCCRIETSTHAQEAAAIAGMLKQVSELNARKVRVVSDTMGSTIYYGEYRRVPSATTDQLVFPPELQRDVELIRSLSEPSLPRPFLRAQPELMVDSVPSTHPEWEATRAKATHSLLIAVFYNTPEFDKRKLVAEQYVEALRKEGIVAYYYHEAVKSFVFVGDFDQSDVIATPEGPRLSSRVEQMIAKQPDNEFRYFSENGHIRYEVQPNGKRTAPFAVLMPLPKEQSRGTGANEFR